tara:strand:- start:186 stop:1298 length:1113 start_codon:yes stop_codon:yes gene_type:complete
MITVVEQEIYSSSLTFYGNTRPTNTLPGIATFFGQSYSLDGSSVFIYRNRDPQSNGTFPPTQKRIKRISIEPLWDVSYLNPSAITVGPTTYYAYFTNVSIQPFIASLPLNNLTQNFFGLSGSDDAEWRINQWGPAVSPEVVNDVHFDDEFVLQPWDDLKLKFLGAELGGTLPVASAADNIRYQMWRDQFYKRTTPVAKVRIEFEEFSPSSQYFHRESLNNANVKTEKFASLTSNPWQDVTLLDFQSTSPTLNEPPFNTSSFSSFQLNSLDFRSAYPWGGTSTTQFMYSIMLHTEGNPPATRYIRKYVRFVGGAVSDLEINGLLKDLGPLQINKGQWLTARLYDFESAIPTTTEAHTARQMPAFWLNGTVT